MSDGPVDEILGARRHLVAANRILAREGALEVFGHASLRHPTRPDRFLMARAKAPSMVGPGDILAFEADGTPVDGGRQDLADDRFIDAAIYEARPRIGAVVVSDAPDAIPFGVTGTTLHPIVHMSARIGMDVPIWDARERFPDGATPGTTIEHGRDIARRLGDGQAVLIRGRGAVVAAGTVKEAVMVAVYLQVTAALQREAVGLGAVRYLSPAEVALFGTTLFSPLGIDRAWEYWLKRAGADSL
ncbi:MAG: class II aldolase/adducin family protein [Alphaproteobacteria bacterium]|nr:class II aldolase/adducin family protein [Alphaproteobacteria bacterium]